MDWSSLWAAVKFVLGLPRGGGNGAVSIDGGRGGVSIRAGDGGPGGRGGDINITGR